MSKTNKNKQIGLRFFLLGAGTALVTNYLFVALLFPMFSPKLGESNPLPLISVASAEEIYPEFVCTCCNKPLDPNNICCGMMRNMIDYIDQQIDASLSKDEIMMKTAKEFGFNALAKESTKQELRAVLLANAPADAPKIVLPKTALDIGQVSQTNGTVSAVLDFRNDGQGDLIIDKLNTSCGCTSASIVYNGQEGPMFTMPGHGKINPENWQVVIAPGDTAQVKIYYDPMAHGVQEEDELAITRIVSIFSNDPVDFEQKIKIELTQLP
jgi:hypothetical protein